MQAGDKYNNPVQTGTAFYFTTNLGLIQASATTGDGATTISYPAGYAATFAAEGALEQVGAVLPGLGRPVAGAAGIAPVGAQRIEIFERQQQAEDVFGGLEPARARRVRGERRGRARSGALAHERDRV